jgi:hypothetical protein
MLMSKRFHFTGGMGYLMEGTAGEHAGWMSIPHYMTGVFRVEALTRNGTAVIPRFDDTTQWAYVGIGGNGAHSTNMRGTRFGDSPEEMFIIRPDGALHEGYHFKIDSTLHTMAVDDTVMARALMGKQFGTWRKHADRPFAYQWHDIDHLDITAFLAGDTIIAKLARVQVYQTTLFGSPRLVVSNYGKPIAWVAADSVHTRSSSPEVGQSRK